MVALIRTIALGLGILAMAAAGRPAATPAAGPESALRGACYCRAEGALHCAANLTEPECRRQCDEALCDDWFWKERLPCWNWGYGG
jgi:hypothetical protein